MSRPKGKSSGENATFPILEQYLRYMQAVQEKSPLTIKEYKYDLILLFRFLKMDRGLVKLSEDVSFEDIPINDIDEKFLNSITSDDLFAFMIFLSRERKASSATRARKVATIKSFFKYLFQKKRIVKDDPSYDLETPRRAKRLPKYLNLEQSKNLLEAAETSQSEFASRDYCIVTLFLNCGMRLSELRNIDLSDISDDTLRVVGKGNKERTIYLNDACLRALDDYYPERDKMKKKDKEALFLSSRGTRISAPMIQNIIKRLFTASGIDASSYSVHKLRHTCATLMYKYGQVDIRTLQAILGHQSVATTQIYTHVDEESLHDAVSKNPLAGIKKDS
ncbi:MAG: tyrosine recombinase XerC [Clostridiales bacterium]|nr:tyrosine recombinase XerC [Clostridiales bacterium]MBP5417601.1 tyrosine recombinase XerC [Clostridiales bacterium]